MARPPRIAPFGLAPVGLAVLIGTSPGTIAAQPPSSPVADGVPYEGVAPGTGHRPPAEGRLARRARRARSAPISILTWPGFQPNADGSSRFFVQTTDAVVTTVNRTTNRVEIVFPRTTIHLANSRRWLETQYFETPVTRARLERRGRDMVLVMHLRADVAPTVTTSRGENGYFFTYVDFGPGHYLPEAPPPPLEPRGSVGVVRAEGPAPSAPPVREDPSIRALDDERPPPASGPRP